MTAEPGTPRVVVVGTCASGKSTLVAGLRERGVDAYVCAQEHSEVPNLWDHAHPDFVVLLEVDLQTVRRRRTPNWPQTIFETQRRRLIGARSAADLVIDTTRTDADSAASQVLEALHRQLEPAGSEEGRPPTAD